MARIIVPANTLVGRKLLSLTQQIVQATQDAARLQAIMNQITANGATPANLESSTEANMPAGSGAAISTGLAGIVTALNGLSATVSAIDQG